MSIRISISTSLLLFSLLSCSGPPNSKVSIEQKSSAENPSAPSAPQRKKAPKQGLENDSVAEAFLREYGAENPERRIIVSSEYGDIEILLNTNTPLHRANMIYLIKEYNYFNGTWFHRVSPGHVIQAGNNDELSLQSLRKKIGSYELKPEAINENYHVYGSVAMARDYKGNPNKKSDPFEFYITLGQKYSDGQLNAMEEEYGIRLNAEQRRLYKELGGSPHLDQEHTVIGKVVSGMSSVEKIAKVKTDKGEWPLNNIPIKIKIKK